jgi:hypothetical protein
VRGAFLRTAPALANTPSRRVLLKRVRHRTPSHVDRVWLCCEGRATKIGYRPPPECYNQHHHRALGQQPYDDREPLLLVVGCLEA